MTEQDAFRRYPGAQPFQDDEVSRQVFFGRNGDSAALSDQILANRLVIVYAKSGSGKTSLLNAGVAPRLREAGCAPLFVRVNDLQRGAKAGVLEGIRAEADRQKLEFVQSDTTSLWSFFKTAEFWRDDDLLTPVLIVDQFEELFTLQKFESRDEFLSELGSLLRGVAPSGKDALPTGMSPGPPPIHVVLSLREDFLGLLEEASDQIPEIMDHRFRLAPLNAETARVAITGPAAIRHRSLATRAFSLEPACVDAILDYLGRSTSRRDARSRQIDPFHLQLICQYIENMAALKEKTSGEEVRLGLADIGGEQAMADTLKTFYSNAIGSLPKRYRAAAGRMCEQFLISPEGRRLSVDERELWRAASIPPDALRLLVVQRLLRTDRRSDRTYYELGHDALVQPVLATRRRQAFLLFRIAIFAGSATTIAAAGLAGLALVLIIVERNRAQAVIVGLLAAVVSTGIGAVGIRWLRSGSRRRARYSLQDATSNGAPPSRMPWYKLAFGWVILVIGPAITLACAVGLLIKIVTPPGIIVSDVFWWWALSLSAIAAFGWFLFQRGDQLLWPDEFSARSPSWQEPPFQRPRLLLGGMIRLILGALALNVACLGVAAIVACETITLRGVASYMRFAGMYGGTIGVCFDPPYGSSWRGRILQWPDQIYLGAFTLVAFGMCGIWVFGGAMNIWRDIRSRKSILNAGSFLPILAVGAAIAVLTPVTIFLWSKAPVARVKTEGWVSAKNYPLPTGYILHTADGGKTWDRLADTDEPLQSLTFTDRLSGWATGYHGLWHTEDGGLHWNLKLKTEYTEKGYYKEKGYPILVAFGSPQSGLTVWNSHSDLLLTTDGGDTWIPVQPHPLRGLYFTPRNIAFLNPQAAWLVALGGTLEGQLGIPILHSTDGGTTWTAHSDSRNGLNALSFATPQVGWATGRDGQILHTSDGGLTWVPAYLSSTLVDVAALNSSEAIAVGFGIVLRTEDGGKSWNKLPDVSFSNRSGSLSQVFFVSPTTGWLFWGRIIMRTEDGGRTWALQYAAKEPLVSMTFLKP